MNTLHDYDTGEPLREATEAEARESLAAPRLFGTGVIVARVDGAARFCFVWSESEEACEGRGKAKMKTSTLDGFVTKRINTLQRKNISAGMKTAYWESTGRKAKSVAHAAKYFGVKTPTA